MPEITIALSQEDFRKIVAGRAVDVEVKLRGVQWWIRIGLKEIDLDKMTDAFRDAVDGMSNARIEESASVKKDADPQAQGKDQDARGRDTSAQDGGGARRPQN